VLVTGKGWDGAGDHCAKKKNEPATSEGKKQNQEGATLDPKP